MLLLSKVGISDCQNMLVVAFYFWDGFHNTFHFPYRMLTPTLFNIVVIARLRPTHEAFDPTEINEDSINFYSSRFTFTQYISDHHHTSTNEVSDK